MFKDSKNLIFGVTQKKDGTMRINSKDSRKNREKFFCNLEVSLERVVSAKLVHGNKVAVVSEKDAGRIIPKTDALVTNSRNLFLAVSAADCLPIFFYDNKNSVIGMAHVGWQGLEKEIVKEVLKKMTACKAEITNTQVFIGPHIQACHFEVKADVKNKFKGYKHAIIKREGKIFIDLAAIAKEQLKREGIKNNNIQATEECTYCMKKKYFSYRRDKNKDIKAMLAYIALR